MPAVGASWKENEEAGVVAPEEPGPPVEAAQLPEAEENRESTVVPQDAENLAKTQYSTHTYKYPDPEETRMSAYLPRDAENLAKIQSSDTPSEKPMKDAGEQMDAHEQMKDAGDASEKKETVPVRTRARKAQPQPETKKAAAASQLVYMVMFGTLLVLAVSSSVTGGFYVKKKGTLTERKATLEELRFIRSHIPCNFTWTEWYECTQNCTPIGSNINGTKKRVAIISENATGNGDPCPEPDVVQCNDHQCPIKLSKIPMMLSDKGCAFDGKKLVYRSMTGPATIDVDTTEDLYQLLPCDAEWKGPMKNITRKSTEEVWKMV